MCLFLDGCDEFTERETPLCFLEVAFGMMVDCCGWRAGGSPPMDVDNGTVLPAGCGSDESKMRV